MSTKRIGILIWEEKDKDPVFAGRKCHFLTAFKAE